MDDNIINTPLLIVMTPVRNEAWVLNAFLKATSLWADYIIIADQMSTDGSREIAMQYDKVILIDNDNPEFNEPERQKMLIDRAREIEGDKILFGLDADEIFAANFRETSDWKKIINSVPGDVFWFKWAVIRPNQKEYYESGNYFPWMFHDDGVEPHGNYVHKMHSMRIPYPIEEKQMYYVDDFRVLHLAELNQLRCNSKARFYSFVDWERNNRLPIALSRMYRSGFVARETIVLQDSMIYRVPKYDFDLYGEVDTTSSKFYFDQYVIDRLNKYNTSDVSRLDLWDSELLNDYNVKDPRSISDKLVHLYLRKTKVFSKTLIIRAIDKILKKIYK